MGDGAIVNIVIAVVGFLTLWLKLKYGVERGQLDVSNKIDHNTEVTEAGNKAAATAAVAADVAAAKADVTAAKVDVVAENLNGKLEEKIRNIVRAQTDPILVMIRTHIEQDDKNMLEIRTALGELRDRTKRVSA